jgi:hypothetical protein
MDWIQPGEHFEFAPVNDELWHRRDVIYAVVDMTAGRTLFVGHTGNELRIGLADLTRWLNGKRKKDLNAPIRGDWLDCLRGCTPQRVEVWAKPAEAYREAEADRWIESLTPSLK